MSAAAGRRRWQPWRGQRWRLSVQLAWRFLTGRRSRLLSGTAWAGLGATAVGVLAMVIAMALMTGYRQDLRGKLIRGNAAIAVVPIGEAEAASEALPGRLAEQPGVAAVSVVSYAQGTLSSERGSTAEVTLRGVDPGTPADLSGGALATPGERPQVVIGTDLAHHLDAAVGDALRLAVMSFHHGRPRFEYRSVQVAGAFSTGFAEFDQSWVVMRRGVLEELTGLEAAGRVYELAVDDADRAPGIAEALRTRLGDQIVVTDWRELNRELFTALKLQQMALFLILGLIVLVATFNVGSTLVVLVRERMRELGVLAALGMNPTALRRVFLLYGMALGVAGTLLGLAVGAGVSLVLDRFQLIRFDPQVAAIYFIRSVPFRLSWPDAAAIALFTLVVTFLACWIPSRRAGRIQPAAALRYE